MRKFLYIAIMLELVSIQSADAKERRAVTIYNGYMTGEKCHEASENELSWHMMGVVNGLLISPFYGAPSDRMEPLSQCLREVTNKQLGAILKKWLKENPERWHEGCNIAAFQVLRRLCGD